MARFWRRKDRRNGDSGARHGKDRSTAHRRFRSRAARVRRRPWLLAAIAAVVLGVIAGAVYLVGYSSVLAVEDVRAVAAGEAELPEELADEVLARASIPEGVPLARVNTGAATERILDDIRVQEVSVRRSWPNAITLVVTPREAAIAVTVRSEPVRVADQDGLIFDEVSEAPPELPLMRIPDTDVDPDRIAGAITMVDALPQEWNEDLSGIRLRSNGMLEFDLGDLRIEWGLPGADGEKIRVLQALLQQEEIDVERPEGADPIRINVSAPSAPVLEGLPEAPPEE